MSASRTSFLRKRRYDIFLDEESEDEDVEYTETEKRERFLEKVEKGARLIRAFNLLAEPMEEHLWGEEKYKELSTPIIVSDDPPFLTKSILSSPVVSSKENKPNKQEKRVSFTPQKRTQPPVGLEQSKDNSSSVHNTSRSSCSWTPVKHVKSVNSLKMQTTPSWTPLRKSKARESLVSDIGLLDGPSCRSFSKSLCETEENVSSVKSHVKPDSFNEPRSPLRRVEVENETSRRRRSCTNYGSPPLKKVASSPVTSHSENVVPDSEAGSKLSISLEKKSSSEQSSSEELVKENSCDESINKVQADPEVPSTSKTPISHLRNMKSPVRYSPILKKMYGEQSARIHGSIVSPDKVINPDCIPEGIDPKAVLKDVVAYVEVRRGEDDRTSGFRWKLKQLGATLVDSLIKKTTHVVFQEGLLSTFRKAKSMKVHLVSALWVMACDESLSRVREEQYPIENFDKYDLMDPLTKYIRRPKVMTPDLGSGRDEKRLSRRFKSIQRRSVSVASSPVVTERVIADTTLSLEPELKPKKLEYCSNVSNMGSNNDAQGDGDKNVASLENDKHVTSQDDDDWDDGFLAMLEAKVRSKTAKLHAETLAQVEKDFKKQLQELLSESEDKTDQPVALASIFTSGKTSSGPSNKSQDRSKVRIKANVNSSASSSLMMTWLKKKTSGESQPKSSGEMNTPSKRFSPMKDKEMTPTAAADALSDEIIRSLMSMKTSRLDDSVTSSCFSDTVIPTTSGTIHTASKESCDEKIHAESKSTSTESSKSGNITKPTLSPDIQKRDSKSSVKQSGKKNQVKKGSEASSRMMMSWLGNKQKSCPVTVNAADSCVPDTKPATKDSKVVDHVQNSTTANEKSTPVKCLPYNPQRRSARLTPVKVLPTPGKPVVLNTVLETSERETSQENKEISERAIKRRSTLKVQTPQKRQMKTPQKDESCMGMLNTKLVLSSGQITSSHEKGSVGSSTSVNEKSTPVKCVPDTPRRRSARLTPVKVLPTPGKPVVLNTVLEMSEGEISQENKEISEGAIKRRPTLKVQTPVKDGSCMGMLNATQMLSSKQILLPVSPDAPCDVDVKPSINRQDSGLGEEEEKAG